MDTETNDQPQVRVISLVADGDNYDLTLSVADETRTVRFDVDDEGASAEPDAELNTLLTILDQDPDTLEEAQQEAYVTALLVSEVLDRIAGMGLIFPFTPEDLFDEDDFEDEDGFEGGEEE